MGIFQRCIVITPKACTAIPSPFLGAKGKGMGRDNTLETNPLFVLGLLKTALESRRDSLPHLDNLMASLLEETQVDRDEFNAFLETYRNDLRARCRRRGYG